jgi:hypothetical protein
MKLSPQEVMKIAAGVTGAHRVVDLTTEHSRRR